MASICFAQHQASSKSLWNHCLAFLLPVLDPAQLTAFDPECFLQAFQADKKHSPGFYHLIVPTASHPEGLGVKEMQTPANQDSSEAVLAAMQQALTALKRGLAASSSGQVAA
jgi:3-dehydroquinate synthase